MKTLDVAGQVISTKEADDLVSMLIHDAGEIAGQFYDMDRSEKFRLNWPSQDNFVDANWKSFVEAARSLYAQRLGDPKTPPEEARKMHLAIVLQEMVGHGQEKDNRLQLAPNSQQFEGDKRANKKILENFGKKQNLRAGLLNSVAQISRMSH
jgi:hypothetical protein